jgi:hypothetical protein
MSNNDVTASNGAQGEAQPDSVFDFLYHDSRRIGSFLSQFDNNGLLTSLTQGDIAQRGTKRGWKVGIGGELPMLAGAKIDLERQPSESGSESLERSYDPFWTNALTFLDFLAEKNLIHPSVETAALGQFVLARGRLTVLDLSMFKEAWALPVVQSAVRAGDNSDQPEGNRQQRRSQGKPQSQTKMPSDADIALDLMALLPHAVHATITTDAGDNTWAVLRNEFMVSPPSELVLTHGSGIPGEWAMLGILSARPDIGQTAFQQQMATMQQTIPAGLINSGVGIIMQILSPLIRQTLGRPEDSYAITPLLIFREVS